MFKYGNEWLAQFPCQIYLAVTFNEWFCQDVYESNSWMICVKISILVIKTVIGMDPYGAFQFSLL